MSIDSLRLRKIEAALKKLKAWGQTPQVFGHMRLLTPARTLELFLGNASLSVEGVSVIDFRQSPLAELFFTCDENEAYELDLGDRIVQGTLLEKSLITVEKGRLWALEAASVRWSRDDEGHWHTQPMDDEPLPLRPLEQRRAFKSPLEVELDAAQQQVVNLLEDVSVLLLGEAGFGKTTVALHRLVALRDKKGTGFSAVVLVPTEGLCRLTRLMLERRQIRDIDVFTFDEWAKTLARRVFRFLPRRESAQTRASVIRFKRHPALREVLRQFVKERPLPAKDEGRHTDNKGLSSRADLEHLFGDSKFVESVVARSQGGLFSSVVRDVIEHTKIQFSDPSEKTWAHVRADNLVTSDGRSIDEATPMEDANTIDAEDYPVLFELDALRAQRRGISPIPLARYDCIVLDEAQEFSPLELALVGRTLKARGSLIVAGDAAQQVDSTASFVGWEGVLKEVGKPSAHRATLEVNYRCPPDVTQLARFVVGLAPTPSKAQPSIRRVQKASVLHLAVFLSEALTQLTAEDPSSSVALLCRTPEAARNLHHVLRHSIDAKLALDGSFDFRPGLLVTCVQEVKGLEFDYVLLPDASAQTYPDTAEARRALYVALTRASHRLTLATSGPWAPWLQSLPLPS